MTPTVVIPGNSVTLSWQVIGEHAVICNNFRHLEIYECNDASFDGTWKTAVYEQGRSYTASLRVEAAQVTVYREVYFCTYTVDWFFDNPPNWCADVPPLIHVYAAAQRFEHGLMIWIEAENEFLVFLDDHSYELFGPLDLMPGASEKHRVGHVPPGLYEPVSGFGLIWRGEVVGTTGIRERLGWARQPEFGFETSYQCAVMPEGGLTQDCYLQGPQNIIHFHAAHNADFRWEELVSP